jgi:hypothetical protein
MGRYSHHTESCSWHCASEGRLSVYAKMEKALVVIKVTTTTKFIHVHLRCGWPGSLPLYVPPTSSLPRRDSSWQPSETPWYVNDHSLLILAKRFA